MGCTVLMLTLRQIHVIASHMGTSSVDRALMLLKRRIEEMRCTDSAVATQVSRPGERRHLLRETESIYSQLNDKLRTETRNHVVEDLALVRDGGLISGVRGMKQVCFTSHNQ
jgi:hypothetical protein